MAPIDKSLATERLVAAERRLNEFLALGNRIAELAQERQQLVQEFFFHAVASIEMVAQLVNQGMALGISSEQVYPASVAKALPVNDPVRSALVDLYANLKKQPMPADPYSKPGYVWRLWNYRHQVSHRGRNPFHFRVGSTPPASLLIDPRDANKGASIKSIQDELQEMFNLVKTGCNAILGHLP